MSERSPAQREELAIAYYESQAAKHNARTWQAILQFFTHADKIIYGTSKNVPFKTRLAYINLKTKVAAAERRIREYKRLLDTCRPAERNGILKRIQQNMGIRDTYVDLAYFGVKPLIESCGYSFLFEELPPLEIPKDKLLVQGSMESTDTIMKRLETIGKKRREHEAEKGDGEQVAPSAHDADT
jgi:hypothetical protein